MGFVWWEKNYCFWVMGFSGGFGMEKLGGVAEKLFVRDCDVVSIWKFCGVHQVICKLVI